MISLVRCLAEYKAGRPRGQVAATSPRRNSGVTRNTRPRYHPGVRSTPCPPRTYSNGKSGASRPSLHLGPRAPPSGCCCFPVRRCLFQNSGSGRRRTRIRPPPSLCARRSLSPSFTIPGLLAAKNARSFPERHDYATLTSSDPLRGVYLVLRPWLVRESQTSPRIIRGKFAFLATGPHVPRSLCLLSDDFGCRRRGPQHEIPRQPVVVALVGMIIISYEVHENNASFPGPQSCIVKVDGVMDVGLDYA